MRKGKVHLICYGHENDDSKTACGISTVRGMRVTFSTFPEVINCKQCQNTRLYRERITRK